MSHFSLKRSSDKQFYFNLRADNGERILVSEMYTTKAAASNGIASVKDNAADEGNFEKLSSANGQFYFNLRARNRQVIGTSEMYTTERARDNGIMSVRTNAPLADVVDNAAD